MIGKIAVEEHFVSQDAKAYLPALGVTADVQTWIDDGLVDVERLRLPEMDRHGIAMQFVSLTADGVQMEPNRDKAVKIARSANDELAERFLVKHPTRFAGFAAAALQDPKAAADELERAVTQLGFKGALAMASATLETATRANTTICRNSCRSGSASTIWTCRFTCIRAARSIPNRKSTTATPSCWGPRGLSALKPARMLCG